MKKFLTMVIASMMLLVGAFSFTACGKEELIVYTESGFPPFEYTVAGSTEVVGVDMEIAKYIANKYNYNLRIVDGKFDTIVAGIAEDNALGIAGISWKASRAEDVEYSKFYWGGAFQTVVYLKASNPVLDDGEFLASNFNGKKVVFQTGTTSQLTVDENKTAWGVTSADFTQVLQALNEVKSDATKSTFLIVDSQVAAQLVAANSDCAYATIEGVEAESYGVVAKKGNLDLIAKVNAALDELLEEDETGKNQIEKWYELHAIAE
ncbi:MAG: transporter substrate-binding domain-containing protein [Clostridiales bacterium]|nr:transporter substrate-binding domain-containing protein [Clostridiales bacterium]